MYLKRGYEWELRCEILKTLKNKGIEIQDTAVQIEEEGLSVIVYAAMPVSEEMERRITDELKEGLGIQKDSCKVLSVKDYGTAMDDSAYSWTSYGGEGPSGVT